MTAESNSMTPIGGHTLPPLPYAYGALAPVIDEKTLRIHHDRHHRKYVDDLNRAELAAAEARRTGNFEYISCFENALAFNGSGHILHSIYWTVMAPPGTGGQPGALTRRMISTYFGSPEAFKAQFTAAAVATEASGWAVLGYNPAFGHLELLQCQKHQNLTQWGIIPVLVCDVWEHAYYLTYQNDRARYVEAWWRLVNWFEVERRLAFAMGAREPMNLAGTID